MTTTVKTLSAFGAGELFQLLRDGIPRTRAELAASTGLARSTITSRIDNLLDLGLITPVADAASTGGRPSARIAINPGARVVAAADIGATHATVAICDLAGTVLTEKRNRLQIAEGPESVLSWLITTIDTLLADLNRPHDELIAIGVGLPGPVEHSTGRPSNPPIMPGWNDYDVPARIQLYFPVPVLVDNDVNIMALGERAHSWPHTNDMVFLKVATGIGSGIISDGGLRRGAYGTAGDVGHIPVGRGAGVTCRCGNTGCLEAIAAAPALAKALRGAGLEANSGADVVELVEAGNLTAIRFVREAGRAIGEMLNMCVSILNPSLIVIGGSMAQSGEHLIAGIREEVYSRSMPLASQNLTIVASKTGAQAGVIGAGILAIEHVLSQEYINSMGFPRATASAPAG
ncbi:ROK family transcriptional regulator [Cryobacterium glaciale]|uniref:ROK family transcriptional regulator n=1 Tax=Cryobacterium glaciale TaxID=1259145 RepID=A0A4R8UR82_9MICO|nr:ROK family transcriptional regulator [Cryobacterium glaciale]TFB68643.1 ROK family transcriptional regulator [Cryobacterium glaciale]